MENSEQVERWNGDSGARWVEHQQSIDRAIEVFGARVVEQLAVRPGARVLDIGCGTGTTVLALAESVGPGGHVLGIDVSEPMLALAAERTAHLGQTELIRADASAHPFQAEFDALFSRFGVMFFARPVDAFRNLRSALRPGGALAFVCWQGAQENTWVSEPLEAMLPFLSEPPPTPEARAPGPFAFAERDYLLAQLTAAGFEDVDIEDIRAPFPLSHSGVQDAVEFSLRVGPGARIVDGQTPDAQAQIRSRLSDLFSSYLVGQDVCMAGAAWLVSARSA